MVLIRVSKCAMSGLQELSLLEYFHILETLCTESLKLVAVMYTITELCEQVMLYTNNT